MAFALGFTLEQSPRKSLTLERRQLDIRASAFPFLQDRQRLAPKPRGQSRVVVEGWSRSGGETSRQSERLRAEAVKKIGVMEQTYHRWKK